MKFNLFVTSIYITILSCNIAHSQQLGGTGYIPALGDYDGNGKDDVTVYRPANGNWYILTNVNSSPLVINWGWSAAESVPGDYDGNGIDDIAVYHPGSGNWYIRYNSLDSETINWGWSAADPVPADYDGNGTNDIAVYHPATGDWYIRYDNGSSLFTNWGWGAVIPIPADYDGDGLADIAVVDPSSGDWYIKCSSNPATVIYDWGIQGADYRAGDFNGDGKSELNVFVPSISKWYIRDINNVVLSNAFWGMAGWDGYVSDINGDGKVEPVVYSSTEGYWSYPIPSDGNVDVLSFNIGKTQPIKNTNFTSYITSMASFIKTNGFELVGFQESVKTRDSIEFMPALLKELSEQGYPMSGKIETRIAYENMYYILLSRHIITDYDVYRYDHYYWDGYNYILFSSNDAVLQFAQITTEDNEKFYFINHQPRPAGCTFYYYEYEEGEFYPFYNTIELYSDYPLIAVGDYNIHRASIQYSKIPSRLKDPYDYLPAGEHKNSLTNTSDVIVHGDPDKPPVAVDYIMYTDFFSLQDARCDHGVLISDHYPIYGYFQF